MSTSVNVSNFARAESDVAIKKVVDMVGFSSRFHFRAPVPIDEQKVIRMNRDTLYSSVVLDLNVPATITMPETNGRYQSVHVISQDHYSYAETTPGTSGNTWALWGLTHYAVAEGNFDDAFRWLQLARANDPDFVLLVASLAYTRNQRYATLREDPRFAEVVKWSRASLAQRRAGS